MKESYNLRFPGQYYMAETGLNQNYFRDYDPLTGKYVESDPIGLKGGINAYGYAKDAPTTTFDTTGNNPEIIGIAVVGVWTCWTVYCSQHGIEKCAKRFPDHANPLSTYHSNFAQCTKAVITACVTLGMYGVELLGQAAAEIGGKVGEKLNGGKEP